jgi:16S rRNA (guanine966-N2)-methyltransferase
LRVIAGDLRGRKIVAPEGRTTRPTSDRVRESLFNLLGEIPEGANVLDLFAGTGALGIEALSRGAGHATFVENDRVALSSLRESLAALMRCTRSIHGRNSIWYS